MSSPIGIKDTMSDSVETKVRKGRPPKAAIAAKKKGGRGAVGRPQGEIGRAHV